MSIDSISWTWTDNQTIASTYIYLENCKFEFSIPTSYFAQTDKTYTYTLYWQDNYIYLTITYPKYQITISQEGSKELDVELTDDILLYDYNKRYEIEGEPFEDTESTMSVNSELVLTAPYYVAAPSLPNYSALYRIDEETGISTLLGTKTKSTEGYNYDNIELGNVSKCHFALLYLDNDNNIHVGTFYINPTKEGYTYSSNILKYNIIGCQADPTTWTFYKCTDTAKKIGTFSCPSGYYLLWQDRLGSQQCQPFNKVDTYSEDITGSEITNYYGKRSLYKVEVQPTWKIQTGWISDEAYRCYEGLFVSPWLKLYNADSDLVYDVILKDRSYTEKTFINQGKLFNLELTLEQSEKQNILY